MNFSAEQPKSFLENELEERLGWEEVEMKPLKYTIQNFEREVQPYQVYRKGSLVGMLYEEVSRNQTNYYLKEI